MVDLAQVYSLVLKGGLSQYKYKNSNLRPLNSPSETKGSIFVYRSKEHLSAGRGLILTSEEALIENEDNFTHWTPNVYRYGTYSDKNRSFPQGHTEKNLRQINCFYMDIDLDGEEIDEKDILWKGFEVGFQPTFIIKTDRGYHVYFVLESPAFVTSKSRFKVIDVAKEISSNLRLAFAASLPVDVKCNHFGIARIPRNDNLVYFEPENIYSFKELVDWSMTKSVLYPKRKKNLKVLQGKMKDGQEPETQCIRQVDEPWYDMLIRSSKIRGAKGCMGRNNVVFTLALACFSSKLSREACEFNLTQFNEELEDPLKESELQKTINSAYSGKYAAARKKFIKTLCNEWISEDVSSNDLFSRKKWTKFKKARAVRKYSHLQEWREDFLTYLNGKVNPENSSINTTKKELQEAINIPKRTLDKLFGLLQRENQILVKSKAGRNGGLTIVSVKVLIHHIIKQKQEEAVQYLQRVGSLLKVSREQLVEAISMNLQSWGKRESQENSLLDTG